MCVIITKSKNQNKPSKEFLEKAWKTNPDGAGYMIANGNNVIISKGYMSFKSFYKAVSKLPNDKAIVYHFRIATHGARNEKGTHPFPITSNDKLLQKQFMKTDLGVAHNGIIQLCGNYTKDKNPHNLSDTQLFIRDYLSHIKKIDNWYMNSNIQKMIKELIKSKMTVLDKQGNIIYIGDFVEVDGYKCSNNYFKPTYTYNYHNSIYDYDYDNYNYSYLESYSTSNYNKRIELGEEFEYDIFIKEKNEEKYSMISDYEKVSINYYNSLYINDKFVADKILVNTNGDKIGYEDVKLYQELLEEDKKVCAT